MVFDAGDGPALGVLGDCRWHVQRPLAQACTYSPRAEAKVTGIIAKTTKVAAPGTASARRGGGAKGDTVGVVRGCGDVAHAEGGQYP